MADEKPKKAAGQAPPYVSYRTFRDYVGSLRAGAPGVIDRTVLKTFSGAVQTQLLHALRYFGLIDSTGTPQPILDKLAKSEGEERQKLLREMLKAGYPFLFGGSMKLQNASPSQFQKALEGAGAGGDTVRKSGAFFISAAKDAAITLSPYIKVPRVQKNGVPRRRKAAKEGTRQGTPPRPPVVGEPQSEMDVLIGILRPEMTEQQKTAVWTLIQYLKEMK